MGIGFLIVADLLLAAAHSVPMVVGGALFWGLHMAATQGLLTTIIADAAPPDLRGTAFGLVNLITGLALLIASMLAGTLRTITAPAMTSSSVALWDCRRFSRDAQLDHAPNASMVPSGRWSGAPKTWADQRSAHRARRMRVQLS